MPQNLVDIELDEVSLVDKGANQHAHVILAKRAQVGADDAEPSLAKAMSFNEAFNSDIANDRLEELMEAFQRSIQSIQYDPEITNRSAAVAQSAAQFHAAVAALAKEYDMSDNQDELMKSLTEKVTKMETDMAEKDAQIEQLTADLEAATKPDPTEEQIDKSALPEAVRKQLEEAEDLKKRLTENEERIQKMQDDADRKAWIGKAAPVGGKAEDIGAMLHSIAKHDSTLAEQVHTVLKTVEGQLKTSDLFKSVGASGSTDEETAVDKVNKRATDYAKEHGTTHEIAVTKVLAQDPSLYEAYRAEQN